MENHNSLRQNPPTDYAAAKMHPNRGAGTTEISAGAVSDQSTSVPTTGLALGASGVLILTMLLLATRRLTELARKQDYLTHWSIQSQIPCSNCRFLNRNAFLKCAVHPAKAMKKDAIDCSDYWPKDSGKFSR